MNVSKAGLVEDLAAYAMYRKRIKQRLPSLGDKELEELAEALVKEQQPAAKASRAAAPAKAVPGKTPAAKAMPSKAKKAAPPKARPGKDKKVPPAKASLAVPLST